MFNGRSTRSTAAPALHLVSLANRDEFRLSLLERAGLVDRITSILGAHNPVALRVTTVDEFRPEAETIAARLHHGMSLEQVQAVVHEEFTNWFDVEMAGPRAWYADVAVEVHGAIQEWSRSGALGQPVA